jgi:serine protease Do
VTAETALNPNASSGITIGYSVGSVADWLRRITVCIRGSKGSRGSGVIWSEGLIVTNAHVAVGNVNSLEFFDGRKAQGRLLARDTDTDLAAISVDVNCMAAAAVRSSRRLRAGEMVIAVGNPWDGDGAVSAGILHRAAGTQPVIFADIRLAPGNSGGPLADAQGNVIGINSAIFRGLGCAVTSDAVLEFLARAGVSEAV